MRLSDLIRILTVLIAATAGTVLAASPGAAAGGESEDRTISPYFVVISENTETDPLPLESTRADVRISGIIANVKITQVYKNTGRATLEAVYVFPGSTRAAVHAMRMTVGERVIEADIMERQQARQTYEKAKKEGKTASLLEQQRPNVFQMNVANILPGDRILVELHYTELIVPEDQTYEFVYPAVVGPRYSNQGESDAPDTEKWVANPYLTEGKAPPYSFDLKVELTSGIPISHISSPSHRIETEYRGEGSAHIRLADDPLAGTRDFVLRYRLSGNQIQSGLLLYPGGEENYFLMMMEPPDRVQTSQVVAREYIFIVDVSGSMNGFPLSEVGKPLMREMIRGLRPQDRMNVLLFAGGSAVLSPGQSLPATNANKRKAVSWINSRQAGGGTEILPALKRALALPAAEGVSRIIVVVTDGYVSVEPQVFELIRQNLGQANLFAFGVGGSVNRHLIEGMARAGMGEPFIVLNRNEAADQAARFKKYVQSPVLTDIRVRFEGMEAYDVEPLSLPDLFAQKPLVLFGKYRGSAAGQIRIEGTAASGPFRNTVRFDPDRASPDNKALSLLWARHRIMRLTDQNNLVNDNGRAGEITSLGLKYHLMTEYTSFVAVDKVRRADGRLVTVKQPLPLPQGVSNLAVGNGGGMNATKARSLVKRAPASVRAGGLGMAPSGEAATSEPAPEAAPKPQYFAERKEDGLQIEDGSEEEKASSVQITVEEIRGKLPLRVVRSMLQRNLESLNRCYQQGLSRHPGELKGEITYEVTVSADGRVEKIDALTSTLPEAGLRDCFKKILENILFPQADGESATIILKVTCGV